MSGEKRLAGGRRPERLGEAPDMMRSRAAADAEIADVERQRVLPELGDLVAVAEERIERGGEGAVVGRDGSVRLWKTGSAAVVRYGTGNAAT